MNYDELKTNLTKVIDNSESIDIRQKTILKTLFSNLAEYDKNRLDELEEEVTSKIQEKELSTEKIGNIVTALIDKKDEEKYKSEGFLDIIEEKDFPKNFIGVFFRCSYEEFLKITDNYTNKDYKIKIKKGNNSIGTVCKLKVDYSLLNKEFYLYKLIEQYNIDTPVIFSRYARKFAELVIIDDNIEISENTKIEFDDELAELISGTTLDHKLIWNVEIKSSPNSFDEDIPQKLTKNQYFIPNEAITQKKVCFRKCKRNQFILFKGIGDKRIGIGRTEDKLYVIFDGNINIETENYYKKVTINELKEKFLNNPIYYRNFYNQALFNVPRIRSKADIIYVINAFNDNPYGITITLDSLDPSLRAVDRQRGNPEESQGNENRIYDYEDCHRYYRFLDNRLEQEWIATPLSEARNDVMNKSISIKNSTTCCLAFRGKDKVLTEDYARYVLAFLNKKYPEFYWIGRYEE